MLNDNEIINKKINLRKCRGIIETIDNVYEIVDECSNLLGVKPPQIICCDSLERNFSTFQLNDNHYIIYDYCLIEILSLYNNILNHKCRWSDIDKFFSKIFAEEFIKNQNYKMAFYFIDRFSKNDYSFKSTDEYTKRKVSYQSYFLVAHEIGHIMLKNMNNCIPEEYIQFISGAFTALASREIQKRNISLKEYVQERNVFFPVKKIPNTIREYSCFLIECKKFYCFVEECYCDFTAYKLLLENYCAAHLSVSAISSVLDFMIILESIRNDINTYGEDLKNFLKDVGLTFYFSFLRTQILLLTLQMNESEEISQAFNELDVGNKMIEEFEQYIKSLPVKELFDAIDTSNVFETNIDNTTFEKILMRILYYQRNSCQRCILQL